MIVQVRVAWFSTLFPQVSFADLKTMIIFATRQKRRK